MLGDLVDLGNRMSDRLHELCREQRKPLADIELVTGDILIEDWSNADIILASAVCYSMDVLEGIANLS